MRFIGTDLDRVAHFGDVDAVRLYRRVGKRAGKFAIAVADNEIASEPSGGSTYDKCRGDDGGELRQRHARARIDAIELQPLGYTFLRDLPPAAADHARLGAPCG